VIFLWEVVYISKNFVRINDRIRAASVRLISEDGLQLGIKTIHEALSLARAAGLDLIEVAPAANPPVCKIIDYKKYRYIQQKKSKTSVKTGVMKEIKFRPKIGEHDLEVKKKHILEFLEKKHRVKILVQFFGREREHMDLGAGILNRLLEDVKEYGTPDSPPRRMGNSITVILTSKK